MRQVLALGVLSITLGCASKHKENDMIDDRQHGDHPEHHGGQAHRHESGAGAKLIVATDPADFIVGRPVNLRLMIHAADGTMVTTFEVSHEQRVHLVIVHDGLDHFVHVHPAVDAKGNLTVT